MSQIRLLNKHSSEKLVKVAIKSLDTGVSGTVYIDKDFQLATIYYFMRGRPPRRIDGKQLDLGGSYCSLVKDLMFEVNFTVTKTLASSKIDIKLGVLLPQKTYNLTEVTVIPAEYLVRNVKSLEEHFSSLILELLTKVSEPEDFWVQINKNKEK